MVWMFLALVLTALLLAGCTQNNTGHSDNNSAPIPNAPATPGNITPPGTPHSPAINTSAPIAPIAHIVNTSSSASGNPGNSGNITPPRTPGSVTPPAGDAAARAELIRIASQMSSISWKADYSMESLLNGTSGPRMNLSMYYDGGNHSRFDMNSVQMNTRIINTNTGPGVGTSVICHGQALNWTCMQVNASISNIFNIFIAPDKAANYTVTALPSRTIAGISASCFNITKMSSPPWAWAAECYSPSGPVLFQQTYMQSGIMTQSTSITALFVSNSVSASDFVPPATPTVLNNTRQSG